MRLYFIVNSHSGAYMSELTTLTKQVIDFRNARDWAQFHTVKNLAAALTVEASELLEITQWKTDSELDEELKNSETKDKLAQECADVLLYLLLICERANIDLLDAAKAKIAINEEKYPVEKSKGNSKKYNEF
jgi:NTP pyrophosphatase (non-canonical NTP hydrolase)